MLKAVFLCLISIVHRYHKKQRDSLVHVDFKVKKKKKQTKTTIKTKNKTKPANKQTNEWKKNTNKTPNKPKKWWEIKLFRFEMVYSHKFNRIYHNCLVHKYLGEIVSIQCIYQ